LATFPDFPVTNPIRRASQATSHTRIAPVSPSGTGALIRSAIEAGCLVLIFDLPLEAGIDRSRDRPKGLGAVSSLPSLPRYSFTGFNDMQKAKTLFAATFMIVATPQIANASAFAEFQFKKNELATTAQRNLLLDRIEKSSEQACETSSRLMTKSAVDSCAAVLVTRFVEAIADDSLTQLAMSQSGATIANARR
jgi:UrcA family protein